MLIEVFYQRYNYGINYFPRYISSTFIFQLFKLKLTLPGSPWVSFAIT